MPKRFVGEIKGKTVVGAKGMILGTVADLEITSLQLSAIVVVVRAAQISELGLTKPFWRSATLAIPVDYVRSIADTVILKLSLEEYGKLLGKAKTDAKPTVPTPSAPPPAK